MWQKILVIASVISALASPRQAVADNSVALAALMQKLNGECNSIDYDEITYGTDLLIGAYIQLDNSHHIDFTYDIDIIVDSIDVDANIGAALARIGFPLRRATPQGRGYYVLFAALTPFVVMWNGETSYPIHFMPVRSLVFSLEPPGTGGLTPPISNIQQKVGIRLLSSMRQPFPRTAHLTFTAPVVGASPYVTEVAPATEVTLNCVNLTFTYLYADGGNGEYFDGVVKLDCQLQQPPLQLYVTLDNNGGSAACQ